MKAKISVDEDPVEESIDEHIEADFSPDIDYELEVGTGKKPNSKEKDLLELINLQEIDGSFGLNEEIIEKYLEKSFENIKAEYSHLNENNKVLSTIIMLIILDKEYPQAPEISLVRIKAISWLSNNNVDYETEKGKINQVKQQKTDL